MGRWGDGRGVVPPSKGIGNKFANKLPVIKPIKISKNSYAIFIELTTSEIVVEDRSRRTLDLIKLINRALNKNADSD